MAKVVFWVALLAPVLLIKLFFVDRYFPTAPGNMWVWIPITVVLCLIIGGLVGLWIAMTQRGRPGG